MSARRRSALTRRPWTRAEDRELRRRYPHESTVVVAAALQRTLAATYVRANAFGLTKSAAYLTSPAACRLRRGDHIGKATQFQPGQVPFNKGLRRPGWGPGRMRETQFTKGVRRGRAVDVYKPIGSERISKDGYLERKIHDGRPFQRRWRAVHLLTWEAVHGPVPAGHAIAFRNGDKADIRLDNLECIPRAQLMARNTVHRLPAPLVHAIQLIGAVKRQIRRREPHASHD